MSGHNLSHEGELRYIIQWFNEWSEFQRDDFLPILADYLGKENYVNGMVSSLAGASCIDKPMSLFQCRVSIKIALLEYCLGGMRFSLSETIIILQICIYLL